MLQNSLFFAKHTLSNEGFDIWNGLDFNIKSYNIYKRETKKYFLQI